LPTSPRRRSKQRTGPLADAGELATDRRLALGLAQSELADLADVGVSSVRALEAGQATMTLAIAIRILDALGLAAAVAPRAALQAAHGAVLLVLAADVGLDADTASLDADGDTNR
jgi:transcriptional regulator with XRE-family HTH domain